MHKTVGELERTMTSAELSEWLAFSRVDPLPDPHWDAALIASTIATVNHGGKGRRPKFEDFLPKAVGPPKSSKALRSNLITRFGARRRGEKATDRHGRQGRRP